MTAGRSKAPGAPDHDNDVRGRHVDELATQKLSQSRIYMTSRGWETPLSAGSRDRLLVGRHWSVRRHCRLRVCRTQSIRDPAKC